MISYLIYHQFIYIIKSTHNREQKENQAQWHPSEGYGNGYALKETVRRKLSFKKDNKVFNFY